MPKLFSVCFCIQNQYDHIQNALVCIIQTLKTNNINFRQIPLKKIHLTAYSFRNELDIESKTKINEIENVINLKFKYIIQNEQNILQFDRFVIIKKNILVAKFIPTDKINDFVSSLKEINIHNSHITESRNLKENREYNPQISLGKIESIHKDVNLEILSGISFPDIPISNYKLFID